MHARNQHSTGGKTVLLNISKKGDRYLRTLLIHGARAALRVAPRHGDRRSQWALGLMRKRGPNVAAVALANKNARVLWKLLSSGEHFRPQPIAATIQHNSTIPDEMWPPASSPEPDIDEKGSRKGSQQRKSRTLQRSALAVYPPRAPSPHTARTN
jgi:Transposase IS116/IS110/IS902 family